MLNTFFNLLKCLYVKLITHIITVSIILSYRYKFIRNFYILIDRICMFFFYILMDRICMFFFCILMDRICTFFAFQFFNEINSRREM